MPLQTVDSPVRDDGSVVIFTMKDCTRIVRCHIQQGALDSIETTRTADSRDRLDRFRRHRPAFEAVASGLYDAGLPLRITADHLSWLRQFVAGHRQAVA